MEMLEEDCSYCVVKPSRMFATRSSLLLWLWLLARGYTSSSLSFRGYFYVKNRESITLFSTFPIYYYYYVLFSIYYYYFTIDFNYLLILLLLLTFAIYYMYLGRCSDEFSVSVSCPGAPVQVVVGSPALNN